MLFVVDRPMNQTNGSFRVKRVCLNAIIVETLYAQGPYSTPSKNISQFTDLNSDDSFDETDDVEDSLSVAFLKSNIVTPSLSGKNVEPVVMVSNVKRNSSKVFDEVAEIEAKKRL